MTLKVAGDTAYGHLYRWLKQTMDIVTCVDVCIDMCIGMCIVTCMDVCIDMLQAWYGSACTNVYGHVCTNVYGHVCTNVYGHVCRHVHIHGAQAKFAVWSATTTELRLSSVPMVEVCIAMCIHVRRHV